MSQTTHAILAILFLILFVVALISFWSKERSKPRFNYSRLAARTAVFGAISTLLYTIPVFNFNLPFLPSFLALHFEEIPAFVAGYAYGPLVATLVIFMKTLVKLPFTSTMGVGELTDLILNLVFVLPAVILYKKERNFKGVFLGFFLAFVIQNLVALFLNVYAMIPFYIFVMGFKEDALLAMCQAVNASIVDMKWSYALWCVLPLNCIKDALVLVLVFLVYKTLRKPLHFAAEAN